MKPENEILDELHDVRHDLLQESGGTLTGLAERLRNQEAKSRRKIIQTVEEKGTEESNNKRPKTRDNNEMQRSRKCWVGSLRSAKLPPGPLISNVLCHTNSSKGQVMRRFAILPCVTIISVQFPMGHAVAQDAVVDEWCDRAGEHAKGMDPGERHYFIAALAEYRLLTGDIGEYEALVASLSNRERFDKYAPVLAYKLTRADRLGTAQKLLAKQHDGKTRDKYLRHIGRGLAERHQFVAARSFGDVIEDPIQRNWFLESLARSKAEAGDWRGSREVIAELKVAPDVEEEGWDETVSELHQLADYCEFNKTSRDPKMYPPLRAASEYRDIAGLFGSRFHVGDIKTAVSKVAELRDAESQAVAWREISLHEVHNRNPEAAGLALKKSLAAASNISDPYLRSVQLILAADVYLELNDRDKAVSLVARFQDTNHTVTPWMRGIASFTTGPVMIGVLVRTGNANKALDAISECGSTQKDVTSQSLAFGQFCAEDKQLEFLQAHFRRLPSPASKAYASLGVAAGLTNLARRRQGTEQ